MNLAAQSSTSSADAIRESGRAFQSLIVWDKKLALYTSVISNRSLKCQEKYFNGYPFGKVPDHCLSFYFDFLTSFVQESVDKHIPSKTSRSVSSMPWITREIRRKIRRKNKTHAKAKKTGTRIGFATNSMI